MGDIAPYVPQSGSYPGTYPIQNSDVSNTAAIAASKLNLTNAITAAMIQNGVIGDAEIAAAAAIAWSKINSAGQITDADIAAGAAIAKSKLAALNISDADIAAGAAIAKSKLAALNITDSDVAPGAAIARNKLDFGSGLVNADISTTAAIDATKVAPPTGTLTQRAGAAFGTTYTPNANRPTLVIAYLAIFCSPGAGGRIQALCDSASPPTTVIGGAMSVAYGTTDAEQNEETVTFIVPPGHRYRFNTADIYPSPTYTLVSVYELTL